MKSAPGHVGGLLSYLSHPSEKANEDLALAYFRSVFGEEFTRQKDAKQSDGYVPGLFILELKARANDWLSGLFQGLAYKNRDLNFSQIVIAARNFLAVWRVEDLPLKIREEIMNETRAPNSVGRAYAKKYSRKKNELLKLAVWNGSDLFTPLFLSQPDLVANKLSQFEKTLKEGRRIRQKITVRNFPSLLKEMKQYFESDQPIKTVRAFYSMLYAWSDSSVIHISLKATDQATLGGELITNLRPGKRLQFKEFVESRFVAPDDQNSYDEYFARFDEALDAADKDFRIRHGIFFTDLDLSRFVMWFVRQYIPELGRNYLVVDPACGSGNLVTNWRSPLELRHKVVSEIEPDLLFAVEKRMKGDAWHNGKFTVVPKVSENRGLNFLDCSAEEYLEQIRHGLEEKGLAPNKPIAFLCNPPYRSDDDQTTNSIAYRINDSIVELTGVDAANERYCCFLAQMKLICEAAKDSGLPGESLLLLFTKSAWLTKRSIFQNIRTEILGSFEQVTGALVQAKEFFDVKGSWPVAFTVWRYKGNKAGLDPNRSVTLVDLTWVKKKDLSQIPWADPKQTEIACEAVARDERAKLVELGLDRVSIRQWAGGTMVDFKRDRRKEEKNAKIAGGLPSSDPRQSNKKVYGESAGPFIGFMDDLTPCRVKKSLPNRPWLNVDSRFMAVKKSRCFSGPPTHLGYCASDLESAKKLFFWYSLGRTFVQKPYPTWIDADGMWAPEISSAQHQHVFQMALAIAYAENECVETYFPANNPVKGIPELFAENPMTPLNPASFWNITLEPYVKKQPSVLVQTLVSAVDKVYALWEQRFARVSELPISYSRPYFIDPRGLTKTVGLVQIKDYAIENNVAPLVEALDDVQKNLRALKDEFFRVVTVELAYFGGGKTNERMPLPESTRFEKALCKRMAVAGLFVQRLHSDPHFGRTKLAKLFYLADVHEELDLQTEYYREAAGPLDQRALYNDRFGIEALARKYDLFTTEQQGKMFRYTPSLTPDEFQRLTERYLGNHVTAIAAIADKLRGLTTDQSEIVATLYACWNDFLIRKRAPTDDEIVSEFLLHWHSKKSRFSRARLNKALVWMKENDLVPKGRGKLTNTKHQPSSS